jgi:hypothetical protein
MIDANTPLALTLSAGMCSTILQGLDQLPHGVARPVYDELRRQIAATEPAAFEPPPAPRVNGIDVRE